MAKLTKAALALQEHETILAHILDPDNSPLPATLAAQFNRVVSAAKMLDTYHPSAVIPRLLAKYNISQTTARKDIKLAQELFKSKHTFDWDYWQQWQIKDLVETIRTCKLLNKQKERIAAHKALREIIGDKTVGEEDPRRMEKNVFYIQLNNNSKTINVPLEKLRGLNKDDIQTVIEVLDTPEYTDDEITKMLES